MLEISKEKIKGRFSNPYTYYKLLMLHYHNANKVDIGYLNNGVQFFTSYCVFETESEKYFYSLLIHVYSVSFGHLFLSKK